MTNNNKQNLKKWTKFQTQLLKITYQLAINDNKPSLQHNTTQQLNAAIIAQMLHLVSQSVSSVSQSVDNKKPTITNYSIVQNIKNLIQILVLNKKIL